MRFNFIASRGFLYWKSLFANLKSSIWASYKMVHWDDMRETKVRGKTFNEETLYRVGNRGRAAGIAPDNELDDRGVGFQVPQILTSFTFSYWMCWHPCRTPIKFSPFLCAHERTRQRINRLWLSLRLENLTKRFRDISKQIQQFWRIFYTKAYMRLACTSGVFLYIFIRSKIFRTKVVETKLSTHSLSHKLFPYVLQSVR